MENYKTEIEFKIAKSFGKALKLFVFLRILTGLFVFSTFFLFIWCDFMFAFKMLLSALLLALIVYGAYSSTRKRLKKLHE